MLTSAPTTVRWKDLNLPAKSLPKPLPVLPIFLPESLPPEGRLREWRFFQGMALLLLRDQ